MDFTRKTITKMDKDLSFAEAYYALQMIKANVLEKVAVVRFTTYANQKAFKDGCRPIDAGVVVRLKDEDFDEFLSGLINKKPATQKIIAKAIREQDRSANKEEAITWV